MRGEPPPRRHARADDGPVQSPDDLDLRRRVGRAALVRRRPREGRDALARAFRTCEPLPDPVDGDRLVSYVNGALSTLAMLDYPYASAFVAPRAAQESEIPNFKASYLGRFPLVLADFWTSDHLSERSRSVDAFSGTRVRGTRTLKRR